jgi:phytoene dehydrogenase-like protein
MTANEYDVVVIGGGIGGLTAAALLAKEGKRVVVLEQADAAGGYLHSFRRGPYTWDPAVHVFAQGNDGALPDAVLRYLGVRDRCRLLPFDRNYAAVFPDLVVDTPFGIDEFIQVHQDLFPHDTGAIDRFVRLCREVHHQAHNLPPKLGLSNMAAAAEENPALFRYLTATLDFVLDEHFDDERVKGVMSAIWPYPGAPPSRLSFVTFATTLSIYLDGAFYCEGSFQSLVDAFVAALEAHGGELVLRARVRQVVVEGGRARGAILADGTEVRGTAVISNADAKATFEEMVGAEHLPSAFVRRLRRMTPSLSAVIVFCGTSLDVRALGLAHEIFHYRHYDQERVHHDILEGRPGGTWASVPTLLDPSLAPSGEHALILSSLARYDIGRPWEQEIERFVDELLGDFEGVCPGLRDSITFLESATPLTVERFCLNHQGAAYAWENTPAQTGGRRSPHVTPVEGLYLSGHWTQPGSGSLRALVSGVHTAQMVLAAAGSRGIGLDHPDLPPAD